MEVSQWTLEDEFRNEMYLESYGADRIEKPHSTSVIKLFFHVQRFLFCVIAWCVIYRYDTIHQVTHQLMDMQCLLCIESSIHKFQPDILYYTTSGMISLRIVFIRSWDQVNLFP